jgi:hypothetical protein
MDRVIDLAAIVQREVEGYERPALKATTYAISDEERQRYAAVIVPDYPRKFDAGIMVMARVADDMVIVEHDSTDRPLWKELMRAGIPRDRIILTYAGEQMPQTSSD